MFLFWSPSWVMALVTRAGQSVDWEGRWRRERLGSRMLLLRRLPLRLEPGSELSGSSEGAPRLDRALRPRASNRGSRSDSLELLESDGGGRVRSEGGPLVSSLPSLSSPPWSP